MKLLIPLNQDVSPEIPLPSSFSLSKFNLLFCLKNSITENLSSGALSVLPVLLRMHQARDGNPKETYLTPSSLTLEFSVCLLQVSLYKLAELC